MLGLVGSALLFIWLESRGYFKEGLEINDFIIVLFISIAAIVIIFYTKLKEINKDLNLQNKKLGSFSEKLKRAEELINIKADIKFIKEKLRWQ